MAAPAVSITGLETILRREVADYAGPALRARTHYVEDAARLTFAVVAFSDHPLRFRGQIVVMARIVDDHIVIDEDISDRPLVDELVRAGVPRDRIVLYYAGETLPETSEP
jgi:hypothetical protein